MQKSMREEEKPRTEPLMALKGVPGFLSPETLPEASCLGSPTSGQRPA